MEAIIFSVKFRHSVTTCYTKSNYQTKSVKLEPELSYRQTVLLNNSEHCNIHKTHRRFFHVTNLIIGHAQYQYFYCHSNSTLTFPGSS